MASRVLLMQGIVDMLPPSHYTLELHIKRPNYQAKTSLQSDHAIMNLENEPTETIGWQVGTDELYVVWKCLPAIPDACN